MDVLCPYTQLEDVYALEGRGACSEKNRNEGCYVASDGARVEASWNCVGCGYTV